MGERQAHGQAPPGPPRPSPPGAPTTTTGTSVGRAAQTCNPVLLLMVARVLWTARPPARPALGLEATMAAIGWPGDLQMPAGGALHLPAGELHGGDDLFGFPASVWGSLVSSAPCQPILNIPGHAHSLIGQRLPRAQARWHRATPAGTPSCSGGLDSRFGVRAALGFAWAPGPSKLVAGTLLQCRCPSGRNRWWTAKIPPVMPWSWLDSPHRLWRGGGPPWPSWPGGRRGRRAGAGGVSWAAQRPGRPRSAGTIAGGWLPEACLPRLA